MIAITIFDSNAFQKSVAEAICSLRELAKVVNEHHEQWLCEGEGQWPDKHVLINRYVRTDCEPPFIFNG